MQVTLGQIYKVKKGHEDKCVIYLSACGKYVKITDTDECLYYDILDKNKERIESCYGCFKPEDLEEVNKYKVGDILANSFSKECMVLEVGERSFLLSADNLFTYTDKWYLFKEMEDVGYKIKGQEEEPESMTVRQVCDELGREIKII